MTRARICATLSLVLLAAACDGDEQPSAPEDAAAPMDAARPMDAAMSMRADASERPPPDARPADDPDDADSGRPDSGGTSKEDPTLPAHCATATTPPAGLECTGLYFDVESKSVFPSIRGYAPAFALWSDGSDKQRWISLPKGETIDNADRNEWVFPIGTKLFKEFSRNGKRIETRMWHKADDNFWVNATYAWNEDETEAERSEGGDITLDDGSTYHIPTQDECEKCHRGRTERILGFDQVLLGLAGAQGVTLESLVEWKLLSEEPDATDLSIGDDGSGIAPNVLGWFHANCGITCHNGNSRAIGYPTGLRLRLDPADLDGRSVTELEMYTTTVDVPVVTANWRGETRIVPGHPEQSWLYQLITTRGAGMQMPPFATNVIDPINSALVGEWIRKMPPSDSGQDAGTEGDAGGLGGGPPGFPGPLGP